MVLCRTTYGVRRPSLGEQMANIYIGYLDIQDIEGVSMSMRIMRNLDRFKDGNGVCGYYGFYLRTQTDPSGKYKVVRIPLSATELDEWREAGVKGTSDELFRNKAYQLGLFV